MHPQNGPPKNGWRSICIPSDADLKYLNTQRFLIFKRRKGEAASAAPCSSRGTGPCLTTTHGWLVLVAQWEPWLASQCQSNPWLPRRHPVSAAWRWSPLASTGPLLSWFSKTFFQENSWLHWGSKLRKHFYKTSADILKIRKNCFPKEVKTLYIFRLSKFWVVVPSSGGNCEFGCAFWSLN